MTSALGLAGATWCAMTLGLACEGRPSAVSVPSVDLAPEAPPPRVATKPPAPLGIASMIVLSNAWVAATSPDLDALSIVEPEVEEVTRVQFDEGAEPGRLVETPDGKIHVVLRGHGEVATTSWWSGEVVRTPVCSEPRGITQHPSGSLVVACLHGDLVELVPGQVLRRARVSSDLRDVVAASGKLFVARFRAAEVLVLDDEWTPLETLALPPRIEGGRPSVLWKLEVSTDTAPFALVATYQTALTDLVGGAAVSWADAVTETKTTIDPESGAVGDPIGGPITTLGCGAGCAPDVGVLAMAQSPLGPVTLSRTVVAGVPLEGVELDDGHRIFHEGNGSLSCAACHPEGGDDGLVWRIEGQLRRTQSLVGDVTSTAPFHWSGAELDMRELMDVTLAERLGGSTPPPSQLDAFASWLATVRPIAPRDDADREAISRGTTLFHSAELGCATCHAGAQGTDHQNHDVGRGGEPVQTPRLVSLAARAPYLHDGCAKTLLERFSPDCQSSDAHGKTSHLSPDQLADLVAYLESR